MPSQTLSLLFRQYIHKDFHVLKTGSAIKSKTLIEPSGQKLDFDVGSLQDFFLMQLDLPGSLLARKDGLLPYFDTSQKGITNRNDYIFCCYWKGQDIVALIEMKEGNPGKAALQLRSGEIITKFFMEKIALAENCACHTPSFIHVKVLARRVASKATTRRSANASNVFSKGQRSVSFIGSSLNIQDLLGQLI